MTNPKRGAIRELLALLRPFRAIVAVSIALGMAGGLAITLLLASINNALHSENGLGQGVLLSFGGLCLLALVSSIVSDIGTSYVGQHIIAKLRKELGEKVLSAPIEQIERYRTHRLIPVLTHDIDTISDFSFSFTPLAIALTITFGCLGYLAYLSVPMFLLTVVAIVIGTAAQYLARSRGFKGFYAARDLEDELQKHYTAIASGAKELRIHRPRRYRMHTGRISETANNIRDLHISFHQYIHPGQDLRLDAVLRGDRSGAYAPGLLAFVQSGRHHWLRDGPAVHEGTTRTGGDHPSHRQPRPGRLPAGRRTFRAFFLSRTPSSAQRTGGPGQDRRQPGAARRSLQPPPSKAANRSIWALSICVSPKVTSSSSSARTAAARRP